MYVTVIYTYIGARYSLDANGGVDAGTKGVPAFLLFFSSCMTRLTDDTYSLCISIFDHGRGTPHLPSPVCDNDDRGTPLHSHCRREHPFLPPYLCSWPRQGLDFQILSLCRYSSANLELGLCLLTIFASCDGSFNFDNIAIPWCALASLNPFSTLVYSFDTLASSLLLFMDSQILLSPWSIFGYFGILYILCNFCGLLSCMNKTLIELFWLEKPFYHL